MIAIASDHAGYALKEEIKLYLINKNVEISDFGTHNQESCDYPDFARAACKSVQDGECSYAILVCGTGIGMSMVANKMKGIRCGLCTDVFCAEATRAHNNANVLALGARVIDGDRAKEIVDIFLSTPFEGGRHQRRVDKIEQETK